MTKAEEQPSLSEKETAGGAPAPKETTGSKPLIDDDSKSAISQDSKTSMAGSESSSVDKRSGSEWIGSSSASSSSKDSSDGSGNILTAIYKPENKEVWKKALQAANEQAEKVHLRSSFPSRCE